MKTKIACIGAGYFADFHLDAWQRLPDVEVVAICDPERPKAEAFAAKYGIQQIYQSVDELLIGCDFSVADIITPPSSHLSLCQSFAVHQKHIICQKPLAPSYDEAAAIVALAEQASIRFMVHENFRFQPWYRKIRAMLDENLIGDQLHHVHLHLRTGDGWGKNAYLDRQPYFREMPRLFIYETGIHYVDVFRYLLGEAENVFAKLRRLNPVIAGEDSGLVFFDFVNGATALMDCNRYNEANYPNPRYTFGTMTLEGNQGTIRLYPNGRISLQEMGKREKDVDYVHVDRGFAGDCVFFTQQHFLQALHTGEKFETNGQDYLRNLHIQEAIYQSATTRTEINLSSFSPTESSSVP
ncbi:MAG: Gfo/Idh/MocA family oxidoreductase [Bacteroidota bacterium]